MKIRGVPVTGPREEVLVLRPNYDPPLVLYGKAIHSWDEFKTLCPPPAPPLKVVGGAKEKVKDESDLDYLKELALWDQRKTAYYILKTLEPSEIEWGKVKIDDPNTWTLWQEDLLEAGFTEIELNRIIQWINQINGLDEEAIQRATEVFQRGMAR